MWFFTQQGEKLLDIFLKKVETATKHQTKSLEERAYKEIQPLIQQMAI